MEVIFDKDMQSRITRYGFKAFQICDNTRCYAYAHATKKGNILHVSKLVHENLIDINGQSIHGDYKIIKEISRNGKISKLLCHKI